MSEMDRFPMFTGHPAPDVPECRCGDGATLRGYIKTYGETPAMTASNREHWKRRAEAAEAKLAARPETAAPTPAPTRTIAVTREQLEGIAQEGYIDYGIGGCPECKQEAGKDHQGDCWIGNALAALSSPVGETPSDDVQWECACGLLNYGTSCVRCCRARAFTYHQPPATEGQ